MKFHIKNVGLLSAVMFASCPSLPSLAYSINKPKGELIFQRGMKLEALALSSGKSRVLRESFLYDAIYGVSNTDWTVSPEGGQVAFAGIPRDVEFFSAASWRKYAWIAAYNSKPRVFLSAYGPHATRRSYSFASPAWSSDGRRLSIAQQVVGNYPEPGEVALYDSKTRREIWNSRALVSKVITSNAGAWTDVSSPVLSLDGAQLICTATEAPADGTSPELRAGQKAPPTSVIVFDIKRATGKIVATIDDQFTVSRYHFDGNEQISNLPLAPLRPQFAWHPTQRKIAFVGPASPTNPKRRLCLLDLSTHKISSLVAGQKDDFSPQWSLDGKQIYWIRGNVQTDNAKNNQMMRANADGSNVTPILPQIKGATQIQLLPKIANWNKYRHLSIEPLAGKDK